MSYSTSGRRPTNLGALVLYAYGKGQATGLPCQCTIISCLLSEFLASVRTLGGLPVVKCKLDGPLDALRTLVQVHRCFLFFPTVGQSDNFTSSKAAVFTWRLADGDVTFSSCDLSVFVCRSTWCVSFSDDSHLRYRFEQWLDVFFDRKSNEASLQISRLIGK